MYWSEDQDIETKSVYAHCLSLLYSKNCIQNFCSKDCWYIQDYALENGLKQVTKVENYTTNIINEILMDIPFIIPFEKRVSLFRDYIKEDQEQTLTNEWSPPKIVAKVRRDMLFEDGYAQLNNSAIKGRVAISFIDKHGLEEAGIDGGGVFKEVIFILT
jgi:hypothetical protein